MNIDEAKSGVVGRAPDMIPAVPAASVRTRNSATRCRAIGVRSCPSTDILKLGPHLSVSNRYRYTEKAGPLENLVTQPYDKISPAMQRPLPGAEPVQPGARDSGRAPGRPIPPPTTSTPAPRPS